MTGTLSYHQTTYYYGINLLKKLKELETVSVFRNILCKCWISTVDIYGFCDSSGEAYDTFIHVQLTVNLLPRGYR